MLKSEMQHQFWITKKTVQRKLGSKEDEHVISSDAELDAKIEVFKAITDTSAELSKIIDQYQERLCILSQEECVFGRFLKEAGKRSKTTGSSITETGKAVSYSGQQRMCVRVPLLRLQHEVDVFRCRAVRDTQITIQNMEKERTEYRAALAWMKSASTELDPDTGNNLEKFRTAQSHVRVAKQSFDSLSMNSIQKIDLLAAARCNMYSHALLSYMNELKMFTQKTGSTFDTIAKSLLQKPKYDFYILKELTQNEQPTNDKIDKITTLDKDQSLFFADDYVDERKEQEGKPEKDDKEVNKFESEVNPSEDNILIELSQKVDEQINESNDSELLNISETPNTWTQNVAQTLQEANLTFDNIEPELLKATKTHKFEADIQNQEITKLSKTNQWMDLFAELDPLGNSEAFDLKLNGGRTNFQQT